MRSNKSFPLCSLLLLVLGTMAYNHSDAQMKHKQFVDEKKAASRKSEKNVVMVNTSTMNELMTKCIQLGIGNVKLVFTRIKQNDVNEYVTNHPEAAGYENDIIGKLTVLVKIEGDNISEANFVSDPNNNSLIERMSSVGFVKVNKPYGNIPTAPRAVYFEIGSICPPPNSCDE